MSNVIYATRELEQAKQNIIQVVSVVENQVYVDLSGSVSAMDAVTVLKQFIDFFELGYNCFHIDMSEVDYIDSFGVGVMFFIHSRSKKNGGRLKLKGLHGISRQLFEKIRLDQIIEVLP
jgi:anti-anti-sigma factor